MIFRGGADGGKYDNPLWYKDDPDYNERAADRAVDFFRTRLCHTKGRWVNKPFDLFPWQEHRIIRPLFGLLQDGVRRIRKGYCEIPKKNGKSELVAGIGCKLLLDDNEAMAEVYCAACDRDQAGIIHQVASQMIKNNKGLDKQVRIYRPSKEIIRRDDESVFKALSSDVPTKHGLNSHAVLFDELHAQPNSTLWDILTEGSTVARVQPLIFSITTAGYDRESICWKQRDYAMRILRGEVDDEAFLPVIYGMDEDEDWENEDNWRAVNPSMDMIFSFESFKKDFQEAREQPYKQNLFRRLRLNQWTSQSVRFMPMDKWRLCNREVDLEALKGRPCYGGLDLASVMDIAAYDLIFPPTVDDPYWYLAPFMFCPGESVDMRSRRDRVPYDQWVREGYLTATPGNVIDYSAIENKIRWSKEQFNLITVGYDRWSAIQLVQNLTAEGIDMIPVGMGFASMTAPTKFLLKLVMDGTLAHGGHPMLSWMAENLATKDDPAGNVKPAKDASREKIDGLVAGIIAIAAAIGAEVNGPSIYETMGIERLSKAVGHDVQEETKVETVPCMNAAIAARYGG